MAVGWQGTRVELQLPSSGSVSRCGRGVGSNFLSLCGLRRMLLCPAGCPRRSGQPCRWSRCCPSPESPRSLPGAHGAGHEQPGCSCVCCSSRESTLPSQADRDAEANSSGHTRALGSLGHGWGWGGEMGCSRQEMLRFRGPPCPAGDGSPRRAGAVALGKKRAWEPQAWIWIPVGLFLGKVAEPSSLFSPVPKDSQP